MNMVVGASTKLAVIWKIIPIIPLHCKPNLRFDLSYLNFVIVKLVYLYYSLLHCIFFRLFFSKNE